MKSNNTLSKREVAAAILADIDRARAQNLVPSQSAQVDPASAISNQLQQMDALLSVLADTVSMLEKQLDPVLTPPTPCAPPDPSNIKDDVAPSAVLLKLRDLSTKITNVEAYLRNISNRCQL